MNKKRKKSLVGWIDNNWFLQHYNNLDGFIEGEKLGRKVYHSSIRSKELTTDKKVRITIEEL